LERCVFDEAIFSSCLVSRPSTGASSSEVACYKGERSAWKAYNRKLYRYTRTCTMHPGRAVKQPASGGLGTR